VGGPANFSEGAFAQDEDLEGIAAIRVNDAEVAGGDEAEAGVIRPVAEEEHGVVAATAALRDARFHQGRADPLPLAIGEDGQRPEGNGCERVGSGQLDGKGAEEDVADDDVVEAGNELEEDTTVGSEGVEQNMVAWMAASSDQPNYGDVTVFRFPEGRTIEGPTQVFARINQDARFSSERTLLSQAGSEVLFGDFLVIPIDNSFLYVEPVYVQAAQTPIPQLHNVIIVNGSGGAVTIAGNLQDALRAAVTGQVPTGGGGGGGGGTVPQRIQALLAQAQQHFDAAQAALVSGNLGTYQSEIKAAQAAVDEAARLAGTTPTPSGTPTPTPSASASASP